MSTCKLLTQYVYPLATALPGLAVLRLGISVPGAVKPQFHPAAVGGAGIAAANPWEANHCMFLGQSPGAWRLGSTGGEECWRAYTSINRTA